MLEKHVNGVDLMKSIPANNCCENLASVQPRTSFAKFVSFAGMFLCARTRCFRRPRQVGTGDRVNVRLCLAPTLCMCMASVTTIRLRMLYMCVASRLGESPVEGVESRRHCLWMAEQLSTVIQTFLFVQFHFRCFPLRTCFRLFLRPRGF